MVKPTAKASSVPSPTGGLNDRDSIADMPATDAVVMDNWWPYPSYVGVRKGSETHVTGLPDRVETLVEYFPASGTRELFAAAGTGIYDVTTAGAVGAAVVSGLTNSRWQSTSITTPGGSFLYMVNGQDDPLLYDGATWTAITGASTPAITGVTPSDLVHVCLFKNRLYFTEFDSMNLWYLPTNSVGGAASLLDVGSVFQMGGSIMAAYTWSIDAGDGQDDHLVVITTNGEVAVYSGTDPSMAATWALVGVFVLGRPLGRRCATKYGGDLALLTVEGVYPLARALLTSSVDRRVALTDKVQNSISEAADLYRNNFGWEVQLFPDANMLIVNIPAGSGQNYQYAQNIITGAWARFVGWDASAWLNAFDGLYYGDGSTVRQAWIGNEDDTTPIFADLLPAFNDFKTPVRNKFFTMVRPYFVVIGNDDPLISFRMNVDYRLEDPAIPMIWGQMVWGQMVWPGEGTTSTSWRTVGKIGQSGCLRIQCYNQGSDVRLSNIDYLMQVGGVL